MRRPNTQLSSEQPVCPVCERPQTIKFKFRTHGSNIYECRACEIEFQYPQPTDAALASIYSGNYFLGTEDTEGIQRVATLKQLTANLYLDAITRFAGTTPARLLEIGCGSGDFLFEARRRGFEVEGLEYSGHAATVANTRLGDSRVRVGSLDTVNLPHRRYDVVAAFDVIEHVRHPRRSLELLQRCLKPGGIAAIVTPSLHSWSRRLLGRHWMEYKTEHLTYFGTKSLRLSLMGAGFSEVTFLPNYKVLTIDYIRRHFARYPVPVITPALDRVRGVLPARMAHRRFRIVASGTMAIGRIEAAGHGVGSSRL